MTILPDFKLETHFSKWEFKAKYHMTASDAESMSMSELLAMATPDELESFESMWLGYTETFGAPELRETISTLYKKRNADEILCFAGASEGIFAANSVILDKDSHAIVVTPNYQSHETLPLAICEATGVPLVRTIHETAYPFTRPFVRSEFREGAEYRLYFRLNEIRYGRRGCGRIGRFHE